MKNELMDNTRDVFESFLFGFLIGFILGLSIGLYILNKQSEMEANKKQILEVIRNYYNQYSDWDVTNPNINTKFNEVVSDDLDFLELIINIETELGITIDEGEYHYYDFETVNDFIIFVNGFMD